jgi:hypothetical protein
LQLIQIYCILEHADAKLKSQELRTVMHIKMSLFDIVKITGIMAVKIQQRFYRSVLLRKQLLLGVRESSILLITKKRRTLSIVSSWRSGKQTLLAIESPASISLSVLTTVSSCHHKNRGSKHTTTGTFCCRGQLTLYILKKG